MTDGDTMTDKEQIIQLYKEMYTAMVNKDRAELERVHDDSFVLVHMTGMRQPKEVYISSIMDGTLNYYSAEHEHMQAEINGDTAVLIGKSKVTAAVFGGGKHTWRLQLRFQLVKKNSEWRFALASASTN
ncbi:nuclear transport factor 2 family protein [Ruminococcus sp. FC2018]|uniref:nuclear transport factor 2 family protein n=1 Tax=Ruminococcus sp. FC2018 TaxID=1410617 RepID=UPI0009DF70F3|nr:nuclear transport factor 2 family protein [Ruminococcus sp. FC2018]